jgi:HlyD family secretion protein
MKRTFGKKAAIVTVLALVAVAAVLYSRRSEGASELEYFTSTAEAGALRNVVNATGTVQTVVTVQVGSQVSGQVMELYADYNSVVKRGQLLAKLDPRNIEAQLENARATVAGAQAGVRSGEAALRTQAANLNSARANLEEARVTRDNTATLFRRAAELSESGVTSRNDFDNAKANADSAQARYEQAQAALEQVEAQGAAAAAQLEQAKAQLQQAQADLNRAQINLEYTNIYSPVDGVVISRSVDVGQTIAATMQSPTLFTIANDLTRMQVNVSVDEADIGNISDASDVRFTVDAFPNEMFTGRIAEIRLSPQTVQNVVTYSVILSIANPDMKLKPGMTANITITVDERDRVLKVPNAALRYTPPAMSGQTSRLAPESRQGHVEVPESPVPGPSAAAEEDKELVHVPLAPGQKWDPAGKIRFSEPQRQVQRKATVWVLTAEKKPESRSLMLGITDGSFTEVVSGELNEGDTVIIGDSTAAAATTTAPRGGGFGPFGPR